LKKIYKHLKRTIQFCRKDEIMTRSAALSFYAVFSFPAAIIIILAIIGFYLGTDIAQQYLISFLENLMSKEATFFIKEILPSIVKQSPAKAGSILGIVLLIISASALFSHLIQTLNHILGLPERKRKNKVIKFLLHRLFSFTAVVSIVVILITSFIADTTVGFIEQYLSGKIPYAIPTFQIINFTSTIFLTTTLFTLIFKFLPERSIRWKEAINGGLLTTTLFLTGRYFLVIGLQSFADFSTFGAASTLIVLLIWIFYSSVIIFLGAEFMKSYMKLK